MTNMYTKTLNNKYIKSYKRKLNIMYIEVKFKIL